jgi:hypothetical protein
MVNPMKSCVALILGALLALALAACGSEGRRETTDSALVPLHPRTREPAIAAIYLDRDGLSPLRADVEEQPMTMGVWADGTVVWRNPGDPAPSERYRLAHIEPHECANLALQLRQLFSGRKGQRSSIEWPDSSSEVIVVRDGGRSWHMRASVGLVADEHDDQEAREFLEAWKRAKLLILWSKPTTGGDAHVRELEYVKIGASSL